MEGTGEANDGGEKSMRPDQDDNLELGAAPVDFPHDPACDYFPREWKDVAWRRLSQGKGSIACPICKRVLTYEDFHDIHMDHFWPRSLMGDSSWSNLRLLCSTCNIRRSNFIQTDIRRVLASPAFRTLVSSFLYSATESGTLLTSPFLQELLDRLWTDKPPARVDEIG
jgi:hypothetical protein